MNNCSTGLRAAESAATRMPTAKQTGATLIAGSIALVLTGLLHPASGNALLEPGHSTGAGWYVAHLLGVGVWPFLIVGVALAARRFFGRSPLHTSLGLMMFLFAGIVAVASGVFGGFVRPRLAASYRAATPVDQAGLAVIYEYNTTINETFADVYQVAIGVAIALLSMSMLRHRSLSIIGWFGLLGGSAIAVAFSTGILSVQAADFHVFVVVNLVVAAWIVGLGAVSAASAMSGHPSALPPPTDGASP